MPPHDPHVAIRRRAALLAITLAAAAVPVLYAQRAADVDAAIVLDSTPFTSLAALRDACLASSAAGCIVTIDHPQTWSAPEAFPIPAAMHLRFLPGGSWAVTSGSLDFGNTSVHASPTSQIFAAGTRVSGLSCARPEWFAASANGVSPAAALAAAYRATAVDGTILFNAGAYLSPFTRSPYTANISLDSPRLFIGVGRPRPDDASNPTRLTGGTTLLGEVAGNASLRAAHLGIDNGPKAVAEYFRGYQGYGLLLGSTGELGRAHGTRLEDITVLTTGIRNQHSVIVEGQRDLAIDGLWIWTLGGTHGLVVKSYDATVHDFHCRGASNDCLIIKSDFATDRAGYSANVFFSDIYIDPLRTPGDTGGIVIDSRWDEVHDITFNRLHEAGLTYGMQVVGSWFHTPQRLRIDQWTATNLRDACLATYRASHIVLSHSECNATPVVAVQAKVPLQQLIKPHLRILYEMTASRLRSFPAWRILAVTAALSPGFGVIAWRARRTQLGNTTSPAS